MIGTLRTSPEHMQAAAAELAGYVATMSDRLAQMKAIMDGSMSYWVGIAGDAHRQVYTLQVATTEEIIARYMEHVRDLNIMAGVYSEAEAAAEAAAGSLPTSLL